MVFPKRKRLVSALLSIIVLSFGPAAAHSGPPTGRSALYSPDAPGILEVIFTDERFYDQSNPFFQSLGTNGRACHSCHKQEDDWTITPRTIQAIFRATKGLDPLFNPVDGTNSPNADIPRSKQDEPQAACCSIKD